VCVFTNSVESLLGRLSFAISVEPEPSCWRSLGSRRRRSHQKLFDATDLLCVPGEPDRWRNGAASILRSFGENFFSFHAAMRPTLCAHTALHKSQLYTDYYVSQSRTVRAGFSHRQQHTIRPHHHQSVCQQSPHAPPAVAHALRRSPVD